MINKAILIGFVGAQVSVKYSQSGTAIANFSVATSETWKDQSGNKQTKTEWHKVCVFKRLAEVCGEFLSKGSKIYVEGKLQTRRWENKDGVTQYTTEIVANIMKMLDNKSQERHSEPPMPETPVSNEDMGEIPF